MNPGTISKLLDYYFNNEIFEPEIKRAIQEFFGVSPNAENTSLNAEMEPFFNEWLIYDFKLRNGHGLLEDFYYRNPYKMSYADLQIYKDLQTNTYGLFEVIKIDLNVGMKIKLLSSGEEYYVREHKATYQMKVGNIFYQHVGKVGDHFELVGSDSFLYNIKLDKNFRKAMINKKIKFTPKDTAQIFLKHLEQKETNYEGFPMAKVNQDDLLKHLNSKLDNLGLRRFIGAKQIQNC